MLENHHVATAFKLLQRAELDWSKTMKIDDYKVRGRPREDGTPPLPPFSAPSRPLPPKRRAPKEPHRSPMPFD